MRCIYNGDASFDLDPTQLAEDRVKRKEVEQALTNDPIPIYEQDVQGELRYEYHETDFGETAGRCYD